MLVVNVNGEQLDLSSAIPLKVKDWKALKVAGLNLKALGEADIDMAATMAGYLLKKAGHDIEVDELSMADLNAILKAVAGSEEQTAVDRPT